MDFQQDEEEEDFSMYESDLRITCDLLGLSKNKIDQLFSNPQIADALGYGGISDEEVGPDLPLIRLIYHGSPRPPAGRSS